MLTGPQKRYEIGGDNDVSAFNQTTDFQTTVNHFTDINQIPNFKATVIQSVISQTLIKFLASRSQSFNQSRY